MSDFIILTDSSADLSGEMAQAADVQVLPLTFTIGGADYHNYPDNREMDPHLFYQRLRAGEVATTAAVNMNQYVEAIEPCSRLAGRAGTGFLLRSVGHLPVLQAGGGGAE